MSASDSTAAGSPGASGTSRARDEIVRRYNVTVSGAGTRPMLFAHGFGCDQNMWRYVAPAFEDDYRVILFDYVGSGRSRTHAYDLRRYTSLDSYARDVLSIITALDLHDLVFVGHSVSAIIGALVAKQQPQRFAHLIMLAPSPRYVNDPPDYHGGFEHEDIAAMLEMMDHNYIGWAEDLAPLIMKNEERPELTRELSDSFCSTDPRAARRFAEITFFADNRSDLSHVETPTLVVQVWDDAIAPTSVGEFVNAALPHGTLRLLDATGHCPQLSHPAQTIEAMREYLAAWAAA